VSAQRLPSLLPGERHKLSAMTSSDHRLTRRGALRGLGGAGLGLTGLGLFGHQHFEDEAFSATPSCTLVAEQEEGPYYLDLEKIRKNITEGKSGVRLDLHVKVVDNTSCEPLSDVAVDIWHAAASGKYSGFSGEGTSGQTFLRGVQLTGEEGIAVFRTIYPGWYRGRATHIHLKAHLGGKAGTRYTGGHVAHTGQMFFSDALTDRVARLAPYSSRTVTRVRNKADHVYTQQGGSGSILSLTARDKRSIRSGFVGRITLGVDPGQT
jgi:protocatechuate 3,4-dioxygenase beta subunit